MASNPVCLTKSFDAEGVGHAVAGSKPVPNRGRALLLASAFMWLGTCAFSLAALSFDRNPGSSSSGLADRRLKEKEKDKDSYKWPKMYGKVPERTIWQFWYHPVKCPNSKNCSIPDLEKICMDSVEKNRGTFEYKLMHMDDLDDYLSRSDLPLNIFDWHRDDGEWHIPAMKDSIMNALLFRHGGVAIDASSVLFKPLDDMWDNMVAKGYAMYGFKYRMSGNPWHNAEEMAVWFVMARKENMMASFTRGQLVTAGGAKDAWSAGYHCPYFALGDQTWTGILHQLNHDSWNWNCPTDDEETGEGPWPGMCPEGEYPEDLEPVRNDVAVYLIDPRDGPQLPCTTERDHGIWEIDSQVNVSVEDKHSFPISTRADCWKVFMDRYNSTDKEGFPMMPLAKMFDGGGPLKELSSEEVLRENNSFFIHWLKLAGMDM